MSGQRIKNGDFVELATQYGLLTETQAREIESKAEELNISFVQAALSSGHVSGRAVDAIKALQNSSSCVPGFEINSLLGIGGFGSVFSAVQLNLERMVALKMVPIANLAETSSHQRFEREAKIVGQLRHPNIVAAHDYGFTDEHLYLSMELVDGVDAEIAIKRKGSFSERACWQIIRQVVMALAYAIENDVIHRDIKPGNLMLTQPPKGYPLPNGIPLVKVSDFGLACFYENHHDASRITKADGMVGTPMFLAPEQMDIEAVLDERVDIYALGITAWNLLSGKLPWGEDAACTSFSAKVSGDESWLEQMPIEWSLQTQKLLRDMCAFDRDNRLPTHDELLNRIDAFDFENVPSELRDSKIETQDEDFDFELTTTAGSMQDTDSAIDTRNLSSIHVPQKPARRKSSKQLGTRRSETQTSVKTNYWPHLKLAGLATLLLICVVIIVDPFSTPPNLASNGQPAPSTQLITLTEFAAPQNFLFNGIDFDFRNQSGVWNVGPDPDQAPVLQGNGTRTFMLNDGQDRPMECFQFQMGFLAHEAEAIDFEILSEDSERVGTVFATADSTKLESPFSNEEFSEVKLQKFGEDNFGYHRLQIERHPTHWVVSVDGKQLGQIVLADKSAAQLRVSVRDGTALFDEIRIAPFALENR